MDIAAVLDVKALGAALGAATLVMAAGGALGAVWGKARWWRRLGGVFVPLGLGAGFITGYAMHFPLPRGSEDVPWYLGEVWKMAVVAALITGVMVAAARAAHKAAGGVLIVLVAGLTLLIVRGPWIATEMRPKWEDWGYFAGFLALALCMYLISLVPSGREGRLWLVGSLVMWACTSAAGVLVMMAFEMRLGWMLVVLAVLAGVAAVAGIVRPLREVSGGGPIFLAVMYGVLLMLTAFYDQRQEWPLVKSAVILLACAPLGAAVVWVPGLRRRAGLSLLVALGVTAAFLVPAVILGLKGMPEMPPM